MDIDIWGETIEQKGGLEFHITEKISNVSTKGRRQISVAHSLIATLIKGAVRQPVRPALLYRT